MQENQIRVGCGVFIFNDSGEILLGLRKSTHGNNTWSAPGGHVEFAESPLEAAKRETLEEAGVELENIIEVGFTNDFYKKDNKQYITLVFGATLKKGQEPKLMEPDKFEKWAWVKWEEFPENAFISAKNIYEKFNNLPGLVLGNKD